MADPTPESLLARDRRWRLFWQTLVVILGVGAGIALLLRVL